MKGTFVLRALIMLLLLGGCKSVAVLPSKAPINKVDLKLLTKKITQQQPNFTNLRGRLKATYDDGKNKQQVIVSLRMTQNQKIWLSANMLIPIAKLLVTPKEVQFYEKFQKTFFQGDVSLINQQFNTQFEFKNFQDLLLGRPVLVPQKGKWKQIANPIDYVLTPRGKVTSFQPTYFINPTTFLLKEQRFVLPQSQHILSFKYPEYQKIGGENIPKQLSISFFDGKRLLQIQLEFSRISFPKKLTFPFTIPEGYKPLGL